jgi:DNA polymerase-3 subunit beta
VNLTINRDAALVAAGFARNAALRRATIPILGALRLTASEGLVEFIGTDLDMEAAMTAVADVTDAGSCAADAERLWAALQSLPPGSDVSLSLDGKSGRLMVKCGRTRFQIPALDAKEFPRFAADGIGEPVAIATADLVRLADATEYAVSRETPRPYITGVLLHEIEGKLRAIGTNGIALAYAEVGWPAPLGTASRRPIPLKAIGQLRELAKSAETVLLWWDEVRVVATAGAARMASKVIDADFPDYLRVIPMDAEHSCTLERGPFQEAVKRCLAGASDRVPAVRLTLSDEGLRLTSRGQFGEEALDEIDADASEPFDGLFNARLLADAAAHLPGDKLTIRYRDSLSPIILSAVGHADALTVMIGMRMS